MTKRLMTILATSAILSAGAASAQEAGSMSGMDHGAHGAMASEAGAGMPAACMAASGRAADAGSPMKMDGNATELDAVQKANQSAMAAMHAPMMAAAMIQDPDLAFNCGMIAHHRGAIAMAKVELEMGKDETSRRLAEAIIAAQEKEIAAMTAWVEKAAPFTDLQ